MFLLQSQQQVHDLRLDGQVERRSRLIEDDKLWARHDRTSYADPLLLAAAERSRSSLPQLRADVHVAEYRLHASVSLAAAEMRLMNHQRLFYDSKHLHAGIE